MRKTIILSTTDSGFKAFEEDSRKNATNTNLDEQNETEHKTEKKHYVSACLSR